MSKVPWEIIRCEYIFSTNSAYECITSITFHIQSTSSLYVVTYQTGRAPNVQMVHTYYSLKVRLLKEPQMCSRLYTTKKAHVMLVLGAGIYKRFEGNGPNCLYYYMYTTITYVQEQHEEINSWSTRSTQHVMLVWQADHKTNTMYIYSMQFGEGVAGPEAPHDGHWAFDSSMCFTSTNAHDYFRIISTDKLWVGGNYW